MRFCKSELKRLALQTCGSNVIHIPCVVVSCVVYVYMDMYVGVCAAIIRLLGRNGAVFRICIRIWIWPATLRPCAALYGQTVIRLMYVVSLYVCDFCGIGVYVFHIHHLCCIYIFICYTVCI